MDKTKQTMILANNVRRLRQAHDITITALSKNAKIDHSTVSKLLAGDTLPNPTIKIITGLANAFGVEGWMLLIEDFPFDAVGGKSKISWMGYKVWQTYERASPATQEYITRQLHYQLDTIDHDAAASAIIKDALARYSVRPDK